MTCLHLICNRKTIKICQNQHAHLSDSLYIGLFENQKEFGASFEATFFINLFDKNFPFVMLHKLAKFHYQTVITFQVTKKNVYHVSCLGI